MIAIGWIILILNTYFLGINVGASIAGYEIKLTKKDEDYSINSVVSTMIALGIKVLGIWWIYQMVIAI